MVLIGHALAEAEHYLTRTFPLKELPWTRGVDLFFVISGFIIVVASYDGRNTVPPLVFLRFRRPDRLRLPLAWRARATRERPASAAGLCLGFGLLIWLNALAAEGQPLAEVPLFLVAGLPAAIIVGSAVLRLPERMDARTPKLLTALGDSSYSLYLSHRFVLRPMTIICKRPA
jgi:peptidoglycan/LPS O-acetylase OafA/YrhL